MQQSGFSVHDAVSNKRFERSGCRAEQSWRRSPSQDTRTDIGACSAMNNVSEEEPECICFRPRTGRLCWAWKLDRSGANTWDGSAEQANLEHKGIEDRLKAQGVAGHHNCSNVWVVHTGAFQRVHPSSYSSERFITNQQPTVQRWRRQHQPWHGKGFRGPGGTEQ